VHEDLTYEVRAHVGVVTLNRTGPLEKWTGQA